MFYSPSLTSLLVSSQPPSSGAEYMWLADDSSGSHWRLQSLERSLYR